MALDARFLGLANGASVGTWADRGGSGRQVTQTGTARPTLQGNWVSFDGTNDEMLGNDAGQPTGDFFISTAAYSSLSSLPLSDYEPIYCYGQAVTGRSVIITFGDYINLGNDAIGFTPYSDGFGIANSLGARLIYQLRRSGDELRAYKKP